MKNSDAIRELRHDLSDIASDRATAKAEETKLRELVEVYGQRAERPALAQVREQLAALDVREREVEAERLRLTQEDASEGNFIRIATNLATVHNLNQDAQNKILGMLNSGKSERECKAFATALERNAAPAEDYAFNQSNGVRW